MKSLLSLSCLVLVVAASPATAMMPAPAPLAERAAGADLIVVGKVTGFGDRLVPAERFKGDTAEYQIAIVRVDDAVLGMAGKEVRVAFVPPPPPAAPGAPVLIRKWRGVTLAVDQEACLLLKRQPGKEYYTISNFYGVLNKANPSFAGDVTELKRCAKLLADPKSGLESKEKDLRFLTAAVVLLRYRTAAGDGPPAKTEAVPAAESKLLLRTLADDGDWATAGGRTLTPLGVFFRLGLTPADGWTPPKDFRDAPKEARRWLNENADKYRVQRFVRPEAAPAK
jgi:hypothetical protein